MALTSWIPLSFLACSSCLFCPKCTIWFLSDHFLLRLAIICVPVPFMTPAVSFNIDQWVHLRIGEMSSLNPWNMWSTTKFDTLVRCGCQKTAGAGLFDSAVHRENLCLMSTQQRLIKVAFAHRLCKWTRPKGLECVHMCVQEREREGEKYWPCVSESKCVMFHRCHPLSPSSVLFLDNVGYLKQLFSPLASSLICL